MPAHSRSKNGVASLAYVAGIHVLLETLENGVDGRDKPGHDDEIFRVSLHRIGSCTVTSLVPSGKVAST